MRKWTFLMMIFHGTIKWKKQHYQKLTAGFAITSTLLLKNSKPLRKKNFYFLKSYLFEFWSTMWMEAWFL